MEIDLGVRAIRHRLKGVETPSEFYGNIDHAVNGVAMQG